MRTSLSAKVLSRSLPKSREEAAIPDLRETVRPRARISLATYSTDRGKTRKTEAPVPSTLCVISSTNSVSSTG